MDQVTDYIIVTDQDRWENQDDFITKVTSKLAEGFSPRGSVALCSADEGAVIRCQTLVKPRVGDRVIREYSIVTDADRWDNEDDFVGKCRRAIGEGWKPVGTVAMCRLNEDSIVRCQAFGK